MQTTTAIEPRTARIFEGIETAAEELFCGLIDALPDRASVVRAYEDCDETTEPRHRHMVKAHVEGGDASPLFRRMYALWCALDGETDASDYQNWEEANYQAHQAKMERMATREEVTRRFTV